MCVDYRKVNDATIKDSYSLPNIDEIFDSLDGAIIFTTVDLYSGYHQIFMDEESVEVTSFTTKFGNYQFKVMPFGLTNAPATFQRDITKYYNKYNNTQKNKNYFIFYLFFFFYYNYFINYIYYNIISRKG